jgi:alkylation response protein AidB-like acyl-CoA dehydrogenase
MKAMGQLGFLGILVPEAYGGARFWLPGIH